MQVVLTGVPLGKGLLTLTGCRLTALGVTWKQPWTPLVGSAHASPSAGSQEAGGLAQVRWRFPAQGMACMLACRAFAEGSTGHAH